jgi:hypothetical protein
VEKLRYLFSDRYVVQLFEVGWDADPPYYVMEYLENGSLEDLLGKGPLAVDDAVGYFREIAVGLVHAHNKGILHCDLKPGNVLLDHDRRPRLADFGQARLTNEMSPALGTLFYMAPEQADLHATPDARWDVYALGAVMYRMLAGRPPYYRPGRLADGNLDAQLTAYRKLILTAPRPAAHREVPGVDAELAAIVDRCLEPSPSKRYPNPQAVVTALDAWQLYRVRRPLLRLTGCGFALLMGVLAAVGAYVFWTSVFTAERGLVGRALDGNRFAARAEAGRLGSQARPRAAAETAREVPPVRPPAGGDGGRVVVLVDLRPDPTGRRGRVVSHPAVGADRPPVYADAVVAWADAGGEFATADYRDPVGGAFAGPWLAAAERVLAPADDGPPADTGWVVVVQERRADALAPVRDLQWRLGYGGALAAALALLLVAAMWVGLTTLTDSSSKSRMTRVLRRWAGLPTGGAAGTGTAETGAAAPGGKTVRPDSGVETPAPGQESGDAVPGPRSPGPKAGADTPRD